MTANTVGVEPDGCLTMGLEGADYTCIHRYGEPIVLDDLAREFQSSGPDSAKSRPPASPHPGAKFRNQPRCGGSMVGVGASMTKHKNFRPLGAGEVRHCARAALDQELPGLQLHYNPQENFATNTKLGEHGGGKGYIRFRGN